MSGGWKDIVKSGWHPEKDGTSLKSQVKGLVGRGDSSSSTAREDHVVTPRSALRDPSSFGPPPKRVGTGTGTGIGSGAYGSTATTTTTTGQTPSQTTYATTQPYQTQIQPVEQGEEGGPPPEPKPYRVDTTGLSTSHLPPPPTRSSRGVVAEGRNLQSSPSLSPTRTAATAVTTPTTTKPSVAAAKPKVPAPSLPPRLPARTSGTSSAPSPIGVIEEAAGQRGQGQGQGQSRLNQGAINRLGAAGISVPGLGIGIGIGGGGWGGGSTTGTTPPPPGTRPSPPPRGGPSTQQVPGNGQVDELQARFAHMGASSSRGKGGSNGTTTTTTTTTAAELTQRQVPSVVGKKKPPPPPIPKKPGLSAAGDGGAPPPIPLATRPRFD